jgi:hypothetical protein
LAATMIVERLITIAPSAIGRSSPRERGPRPRSESRPGCSRSPTRGSGSSRDHCPARSAFTRRLTETSHWGRHPPDPSSSGWTTGLSACVGAIEPVAPPPWFAGPGRRARAGARAAPPRHRAPPLRVDLSSGRRRPSGRNAPRHGHGRQGADRSDRNDRATSAWPLLGSRARAAVADRLLAQAHNKIKHRLAVNRGHQRPRLSGRRPNPLHAHPRDQRAVLGLVHNIHPSRPCRRRNSRH